ncbi:hypothetical protein PFISCL1PPCAC_17645, partial [Pristionchus fissidentatus]
FLTSVHRLSMLDTTTMQIYSYETKLDNAEIYFSPICGIHQGKITVRGHLKGWWLWQSDEYYLYTAEAPTKLVDLDSPSTSSTPVLPEDEFRSK